MDIMHGVFDTKDPRNYCLCFRREWQHIDNTTVNALENYLDVMTDSRNAQVADVEAHRRVQHLGNKVE